MKVYLGADHGGVHLKDAIKEHLTKKGVNVEDLGTNGTDSVDYPEYGHKVAKKVIAEDAMGIVVCGSGIGISIAANRHKGIRAALVHTIEEAKLTRQHNNANVLALGGRVTSNEDGIKIADAFLAEPFEGGRHERRVGGIDNV